ncbi:DUF1800 domain-containing protein [Crocinitomicaceae bacterium]|nr:DUF1800 domain-containing protein [Crocinitomicaceae bacterium]
MPENEPLPGVSLSLTPYSGPWTKVEAAHLLRRTTFGATNQEILDAVTNGMNATVTSLMQIPAIGEPLAYHPDETIVAQGQSWVNAVYPSNVLDAQTVETARLTSLAGWAMQRLNSETLTIAEKICLFWHNHFSATPTQDSRATYDYHALLRSHALGDFKQMVKDVTVNPCMLLFLNGAENNVFSPNENYARELLELFTIGKGPQIGPGDYTNYTEYDVAEAAKILTGYYVTGLRSDSQTSVDAVYDSLLHDQSNKTMSAAFNSASIPANGANEYEDLIDVIFLQDEVANYICRKFYRYFVNYDLTSTVESTVIAEMANTFIANNYQIEPVLTELFLSEHFYDISVRGALIKGPMDMLYSMLNQCEAEPNFNLATDYEMLLNVYWLGEALGQAYAFPPSVAGWPAYYQTPSFSKLWVNATHIKTRFDIALWMTLATGIPVNGDNFKIDALHVVDSLSLSADAPTVIQDLTDMFCPKGLTATQQLTLKLMLTNGLPDFEWTLEYNDYQANIGDPVYEDPVRTRVELVLSQIFQMPEFHTM